MAALAETQIAAFMYRRVLLDPIPRIRDDNAPSQQSVQTNAQPRQPHAPTLDHSRARMLGAVHASPAGAHRAGVDHTRCQIAKPPKTTQRMTRRPASRAAHPAPRRHCRRSDPPSRARLSRLRRSPRTPRLSRLRRFPRRQHRLQLHRSPRRAHLSRLRRSLRRSVKARLPPVPAARTMSAPLSRALLQAR